MPKLIYVRKKFYQASLDVIDQANTIIAEYQAEGFKLTLRQLYYQFVARDLLANNIKNYKRLGNIISDGRLAGLIDWDALEDRTRNLLSLSHWGTPADVISAAAYGYNEDLWAPQKHRVEVWVEKEALAGVLGRVAEQNDLPIFACKGYTSQSEMWGASMRLRRHNRKKQGVVILHFGDHDPSGIDMTRDIRERLDLFQVDDVEIRRMALNMDQIDRYNPPPNPAKDNDPRFADYTRKYGDESWELDALNPKILAKLVNDEVDTIRDMKLWEQSKAQQQTARNQLQYISSQWDRVVNFSASMDRPDFNCTEAVEPTDGAFMGATIVHVCTVCDKTSREHEDTTWPPRCCEGCECGIVKEAEEVEDDTNADDEDSDD